MTVDASWQRPKVTQHLSPRWWRTYRSRTTPPSISSWGTGSRGSYWRRSFRRLCSVTDYARIRTPEKLAAAHDRHPIYGVPRMVSHLDAPVPAEKMDGFRLTLHQSGYESR